jgi:uncharacterized damage-inducible protein DinB
LFSFDDWARDKLLTAASALTEVQLDQRFEMGEGSLRATLNHLCSAERVWLDRWTHHPPRYRTDATGVTMPRLWQEFRDLSAERNEFLDGRSQDQLDRPLTYTNLRGQTITLPLGGLMLHVSNHGSHHRAQAVNMLRRVGHPLPPPGADYIFMKLEQPGATACALDAGTLRTYFAYGDWANARVLSEAAKLADASLDRAFEIGLGSLRKTLIHVRDAEQWWLENWIDGPGRVFPPADESLAIERLADRFRETAAQRNSYLQRAEFSSNGASSIRNAGLARLVRATPRPNVHREFPLGVTMLQLNHHGTHHRAQALNMLRHLGAAVPALDMVLFLMERHRMSNA